MSTRPTVLLFDIDGTLVTTGGVGRRSLEKAFFTLFGVEQACRHIQLDGMTDRTIVRLGLQAIGQEATAPAIDRVLDAYVRTLEQEVQGADMAQYRVHAGMEAALDVAAARAGVAIGLGTGNIREGARVKLSRVGLYERFSFGGFGCDAEDRTALIRRGAERGAQKLGEPLERCRVVIIGDTPKDVAAALGIGGECIGVGTGPHAPEKLLACGARHAFPDLTAPGALAALLDG